MAGKKKNVKAGVSRKKAVKTSGKKKKAAVSAPKKKNVSIKKTTVKTKTAKPAVKKASVNKKKSVPAAAPAKKTSSGRLTNAQIEHFKKKLLAEKQRVLEEIGEMQNTNLKQSISEQAGELSRYSYHLGDTASLSYDREFSMGLAERHQKYLEQVDDALDRIREGSYGICRVTGEVIPVERLEEVPVAKYSVRGKEIVERQKRAQGFA